VESGKFITNKKLCKQIIKESLAKTILKHNIDVVTLSSTHLPFLSLMLKEQFPNVKFLDPANDVAIKIAERVSNPLKRNILKIYTSKNPKSFHRYLKKIGIRNKVNFLP
jgi:glutamate racemase